jgi:CRP/FNR family transcriptional regulator
MSLRSVNQSLPINNLLENFFTQKTPKLYLKNQAVEVDQVGTKQVWWIKSGYLRSYSTWQNGSILTLNYFRPNALLPLYHLFGLNNPQIFYETVSKARLLVAPTTELIEYLTQYPTVYSELTRRVVKGVTTLAMRANFLLQETAAQKVALSLLLLNKQFGPSYRPGEYIHLPLTHQNIAEYSGVTRETTSIIIKELEKTKLILKRARNYQICHENELVSAYDLEDWEESLLVR